MSPLFLAVALFGVAFFMCVMFISIVAPVLSWVFVFFSGSVGVALFSALIVLAGK